MKTQVLQQELLMMMAKYLIYKTQTKIPTIVKKKLKNVSLLLNPRNEKFNKRTQIKDLMIIVSTQTILMIMIIAIEELTKLLDHQKIISLSN